MQLDATEKQPITRSVQKETQKYYNYGVKKYLARNYWKAKTGLGPQKK